MFFAGSKVSQIKMPSPSTAVMQIFLLQFHYPSLTKFASRGDGVSIALGEPSPLHYHDKEPRLHVFWGLKGESN